MVGEIRDRETAGCGSGSSDRPQPFRLCIPMMRHQLLPVWLIWYRTFLLPVLMGSGTAL